MLLANLIKKESLSKRFFFVLSSFLIILPLFMLAILKLPLDPDFGWHLYLGKTMVSSKQLISDHVGYNFFSTLETIDHEWFSNILLYLGYSKFGYLFLAACFFFILALIFFLQYKNARKIKANSYSAVLALFLVLLSVIPFYGVRLQSLIWLGIALIFTIRFSSQKKVARFILYFFLFWIGNNFHSGFFTLSIIPLFLEITQKKGTLKPWLAENIKNLCTLILLEIVAFSLNPNGIEYWRLIQEMLTSRYYLNHIQEWVPFYAFPHIKLIEIIIPLSTIIFFFTIDRFWRRLPWNVVALLIIYGIAGLKSQRNFPIFMMVIYPYLAASISIFFKSTAITKKRFLYLIACVYFLILLLLTNTLVQQFNLNTFKDPFSYPVKDYPFYTSVYLAENPRAGNIFNPYEWGGYLLWKNPSSEIFIDGRGPQVKVDQNKSILEEYFQFLADDETIKNKISKYGISRIVIKKQESVKLDFVNSFFAKYLVSSSEMKVMNKETNLVIYLSQSEDWKKAYEDSNSIVYDKK